MFDIGFKIIWEFIIQYWDYGILNLQDNQLNILYRKQAHVVVLLIPVLSNAIHNLTNNHLYSIYYLSTIV